MSRRATGTPALAEGGGRNFLLWMILNLEVWYRLFICGQSRGEVRAWIASLLPSQPRLAASPSVARVG